MSDKKDWIIEMIEREATPKSLRTETIKAFSDRNDIDTSLYQYHKVKPDNQKRIVKLCLDTAKEMTPEVLDKLGQNAIEGKEKSIEMFLKYITELAEKTDITSGGKPIPILNLNNVLHNNSNSQDSSNEEEDKSSPRGNECE